MPVASILITIPASILLILDLSKFGNTAKNHKSQVMKDPTICLTQYNFTKILHQLQVSIQKIQTSTLIP